MTIMITSPFDRGSGLDYVIGVSGYPPTAGTRVDIYGSPYTGPLPDAPPVQTLTTTSSDQKLVVHNHYVDRVEIFDYLTGAVVMPAELNGQGVVAVSMSANGAFLAVIHDSFIGGTLDGLRIYETTTWTIVSGAPTTVDALQAGRAVFAPTGPYLYVVDNNTLTVYDSSDAFGVVETIGNGVDLFVFEAVPSYGGGYVGLLIFDDVDLIPQVRDTSDWSIVYTSPTEYPTVTLLDVSSNGDFLALYVKGAAQLEDGNILSVIETATGDTVYSREFQQDYSHSGTPNGIDFVSFAAKFSPNSQFLAVNVGPVVESTIVSEVISAYVLDNGFQFDLATNDWEIAAQRVTGGGSILFVNDVDIEEVFAPLPPLPYLDVVMQGDLGLFTALEFSSEAAGGGHQVGYGVGEALGGEAEPGDGEDQPATGHGHQVHYGQGNVETPGSASIFEKTSAGDELDYTFVLRINEIVRVALALHAASHTTHDFAEAVVASDLARLTFPIALAEAAEISDATTGIAAIHLAERLIAQDTTLPLRHALAVAVLALSVQDVVGLGDFALVLETIATDDAVKLRIGALAAEVAEILDTPAMTMRVAVNDTLLAAVGDEVTAQGVYQALVSEAAQALLIYHLGDAAYVGYVMNTEGDKPVSMYAQYPFNSFTRFAGSYYGASDGGLFRLEGDDDAGEPIAAWLKTLMLDFDTSAMKRVQTAYIGYTATGDMVLKVLAVTQGSLREHWFKAIFHTADAPREHVKQLGRGLASRYWQFELANVDGADFEVDKIEFHPIALNRRV